MRLSAALAAILAFGAAITGAAPAHAAVVGNGSPSGCTSAAVVAAVAQGGTISFDCGPGSVTIDMAQTAKIENASPSVVLDGGGKVTLSGQGARRILYMDTCDRAQGITSPHCQQQATPRLSIENMTLEGGDSSGDGQTGGGALYAFGGGLTIRNSTFLDNRCAPVSGSDVGGGAVAALWQDHAAPVQITGSRFSGNVCDNGGAGGGGGAIFSTQNRLSISGSTFSGNSCPTTGPDVGGGAARAYIMSAPVQVTDSTFTSNTCSNGGALSSIDASWTVRHSSFTGNQAVGTGANPPAKGTPGGGSGGAIYNDGNLMHLSILDSTLSNNTANEGGGAIFFVSDNHTGTLSITGSRLIGNPNQGFQTTGLPGIFFIGAHRPTIHHSVLKP
jgi:polymorphic membrane protein